MSTAFSKAITNTETFTLEFAAGVTSVTKLRGDGTYTWEEGVGEITFISADAADISEYALTLTGAAPVTVTISTYVDAPAVAAGVAAATVGAKS